MEACRQNIADALDTPGTLRVHTVISTDLWYILLYAQSDEVEFRQGHMGKRDFILNKGVYVTNMNRPTRQPP